VFSALISVKYAWLFSQAGGTGWVKASGEAKSSPLARGHLWMDGCFASLRHLRKRPSLLIRRAFSTSGILSFRSVIRGFF
jgi:hypothetical protein